MWTVYTGLNYLFTINADFLESTLYRGTSLDYNDAHTRFYKFLSGVTPRCFSRTAYNLVSRHPDVPCEVQQVLGFTDRHNLVVDVCSFDFSCTQLWV